MRKSFTIYCAASLEPFFSFTSFVKTESGSAAMPRTKRKSSSRTTSA